MCGGRNDTCAGCDGQLNSSKVNDVCGVCGGDGSSCNVTKELVAKASRCEGVHEVQRVRITSKAARPAPSRLLLISYQDCHMLCLPS